MGRFVRKLPLVLVALVALAAGGAVAIAASSSSSCSAPCRIVISEVRTNGSGAVTTDQQTISVPAKTVTNTTTVTNTVTSPPVTTTVTVTTPPPTTTTTTTNPTTTQPPPPPPANFTEGFNSGQPGFGDLWGGPDYYATAHAPGWVSDCDTSYIHSVSVPDKPTNVGYAHGSDYCQRWYTKQTFTGAVTKVEADVKPLGWGAGLNASYAGFKFYLRRQAPADATPTYTIEFYIRDGSVHIQKGDCGGGYNWYSLYDHIVDPTDGSYGTSNTWHHFEGDAITNPDGSVTLKLIRDGNVIAQATDSGGQAGCTSPLYGGVEGIRSDWAEYYIDDFTVTSSG
jgi:hypothetical protein